MTEESPQVTEEPADVEASETPRVRRKKEPAPPMTVGELKDQVVSYGERVGTAFVGWLSRLAGENTEKVKNVANRIVSDLEGEDDDETPEEKV